MKKGIEFNVKSGELTQEQADKILKKLENGDN